MTHRTRLVAALVAVTLPLVGLVSTLHARAAAPAVHAQATVQVVIQNFAFSPSTITVAPGTKVVWTQKDSAPHTVTSDNNAFPGSSDLSPNQTYSYTFTKPGKYPYHCSVHPNMVATVIVAAGGASSANSGQMTESMMGMMGPMSKTSQATWTGYYDGHKVLYLSTDTSSKSEAKSEHINYSASLAKTLPSSSKIYLTMNGKYASRGPAFGSEPGEDDYTPLWQEVQVTWKDASKATFLGSDNDVNAAAKAGKVALKMTGIVLNCPIIKVLGS